MLSGGGARGAYEAGVAKELARTQSFDIVCGSSIGALNAAFVAQHSFSEIERFWTAVVPSEIGLFLPHVPRLRNVVQKLGSMGSGDRFRDFRHLLHAMADMHALGFSDGRFNAGANARAKALAARLEEFFDIKELGSTLIVAGTNISEARPCAFLAHQRSQWPCRVERYALTQENYVLALLASAALPGLFAPIEMSIGGRTQRFADGGLLNNSPIGLALEAGATDLTVVLVDDPNEVVAAEPSELGDLFYTIFILLQQRLLEDELRMVAMTNELIRAGRARGRELISVHQVRPATALGLGTLDFDRPAALQAAFNQGTADAQRHREEQTAVPAVVSKRLNFAWPRFKKRLFARPVEESGP